jgi:tellurite resistance protein
MAIRKVLSAKKVPVKKAASKKASPKKASASKRSSTKANAKKKQGKENPKIANANADKAKPRKSAPGKTDAARSLLLNTPANNPTGKKRTSHNSATTKNSPRIAAREKKACVFDSERAAERVELSDGNEPSVSVEALKIGLLLAAIDGHCDKNEIKKFKTIAKSCGGLSDAKIDQIVSQMHRRISVLEDAAKHGASDEELVDKFMSEASNIGIRAECRNFVLWMSIAMVDGDYSGIEQKAITALREHANRSRTLSFLFRRDGQEISDMFLKRCQMILSGIYMADSVGNKRLMANRMKSLQTLIEIAEA